MKAPTLSRICAHSGSSLGSKTTHLRACEQAFLDEQRGTPDRDVFPLARLLVGAVEGASTPGDVAEDREIAQFTLMPSGLRLPVLARSVSTVAEVRAEQYRLGPGGCLPHPPRGVGPGIHAGEGAARRDVPRPAAVERVGHEQAREIDRGVIVLSQGVVLADRVRPGSGPRPGCRPAGTPACRCNRPARRRRSPSGWRRPSARQPEGTSG